MAKTKKLDPPKDAAQVFPRDERLEKLRANAANARAVLAKKRASGQVFKKRTKPVGNLDSLGGRIDLILSRLGKKRTAFTNALELSNGYVSKLERKGYLMKPERMAQAAKFLGVPVDWLAHGGPVPDVGAPAPAKPPNVMPSPDPNTFVGRIDMRLGQLGKTRHEFETAMGVGRSYLAQVRRAGWTFRPALLTRAAAWLGVAPEWLASGGATSVVAVPGPKMHKPPKLNGTPVADHAARVEASMHGDADTAMQSVWSMLAVDVKVFLIARASELLAQHMKRGGVS